MGSVSVGTVSIFVCLHVGRVCIFVCVHEGGNVCLCIWVLVVYVYVSGRALDSTSLIISVDPHPTTMPCRWRMPPVRWWFLAPGQDARVSAGPLSAVAWRGLALLALLGPDWGWGAFGSPGPGPGRPGVVDCRWSLRACRHGTLGRLHCGCRRSHLRALLCPFLGGGRGCPCGGSPGGPVSWGAPDVWGPDLFHACFMPCGMGLLFPTHTIKHLHGGTLWTQARSHTQVYTQAFTLV